MNSNNSNDKPIIVAVIGAIALLVAAVIAYRGQIEPVERIIRATQTAEASAATATWVADNPPTATPSPPTATPTPGPTPQVTIPADFVPVVDSVRGYSLAVPLGWGNFDLRSEAFVELTNSLGVSDRLNPLNELLASPEGEKVGVVYVTDIMSAMFGGLPTALNVTVVDAADATPDQLLQAVEDFLLSDTGLIGDVTIDEIESATINNIPGVRALATSDLSSIGLNANLFIKVAALHANDKLFILTLVAYDDYRAQKEPIFDQIIGTFRPE